jgi:hypothetical protein
MRCLLLRRNKIFFFIFMMLLLHRKKKNALLFTTHAPAPAPARKNTGFCNLQTHIAYLNPKP